MIIGRFKVQARRERDAELAAAPTAVEEPSRALAGVVHFATPVSSRPSSTRRSPATVPSLGTVRVSESRSAVAPGWPAAAASSPAAVVNCTAT